MMPIALPVPPDLPQIHVEQSRLTRPGNVNSEERTMFKLSNIRSE